MFATASKRPNSVFDDNIGDPDFDIDVANAAMDDEHVQKKKKGLRASDLGPARKRILDGALSRFRLEVALNPFMAEKEENEVALKSWTLVSLVGGTHRK